MKAFQDEKDENKKNLSRENNNPYLSDELKE